jgi:putative membrane protein
MPHQERGLLLSTNRTGAVIAMTWLFAAEDVVHSMPHDFLYGAVASALFGLIGIALLLLGYWLFDMITPKLDVQKELCEKNVAVAIVVAALLLGIAYMAAHVIQ